VQEDDIIELTEELLTHILKDRNIKFSKMEYTEAIENYGIDTCDVRFGMKIVDITDILKTTEFNIIAKIIQAGGKVKGICVNSADFIKDKDIDTFTSVVSTYGAGLLHFRIKDGNLVGPFAKFFTQGREIIDRFKAKPSDLILIIADKDEQIINKALGNLRMYIGNNFKKELNVDDDELSFVWLLHPPLFEYSKEEDRLVSLHHPFTRPLLSDYRLLDKDPLKVKSLAYDIILNGIEIGGGSIRIEDRKLQEKIFKILNMEEKVMIERFGFY
jgi:aspartyl-tRNA synthetase